MSDTFEKDASDFDTMLTEKTSSHTLLDNFKSLAAGGVGGVCAVLTGHPFDLLKVRCQSSQASGTLDAIRRILQEAKTRPGMLPLNQLRGFYRGVIPPLVGVTPIFAVSFWGYDVGKRLVSWGSSPVTDIAGSSSKLTPLTTNQLALAGFISAIPTTLIMAPTERVKVVMQTSERSSFVSAAKKIIAEGGVQSLFRGSLATLARDGPGSALYFASYEFSKEYLSRNSQDADKLSVVNVCIAGGIAGMSMWIGVFPIDTIKTKLQSSSSARNMSEAAREIYGRAGVKGFFPGLGPALMRSFPANAATFLGVELTHQLFKKYNI
ncbi:LANO_0H08922g1_1 [Lachancea nothofagi CBS 11611]|uniref:LANO_0H08922g1_1 n=1 Tax=Lachancea nothofagi CBS 11611 TaxID=1266666 RepID=A0A1G4KLQ1_9SACH|nr:LANO_0H08922g1_1 [Lachancea nothofagi CBS 11611]